MLRVADLPRAEIETLLSRFGLRLVVQSPGEAIKASFWGDCEAGIAGDTVYVRNDTPLHSLLHETSHVICMSAERRAQLDRDAGGDDLEESAVCYLQIKLANSFDGVGQDALMRDMDTWGYSFRLGSTRDWFQNDAEDAAEFLVNHGLLCSAGQVTFALRQ